MSDKTKLLKSFFGMFSREEMIELMESKMEELEFHEKEDEENFEYALSKLKLDSNYAIKTFMSIK